MNNTMLYLLDTQEMNLPKNRKNSFHEGFATYFHFHYEEGKASFLLNIISAKDADYAYTITDIHGNIFQKGEIYTSPQDFQIAIETPNIQQGVYIFCLESFDGAENYKSRFFVNESNNLL